MEKIADYTLLEKLGETGRSVVYRARGEDGGTRVVKLLKTDRATPTDIARFRQEYGLIKSIDLPGVIRTFDIVTHAEGLAIVLEDCEGGSLRHVIKNEPLDMAFFLEVAQAVARTLGELHAKRIVHGDIKPGNIIVNREKKIIKLTDFGIARAITHETDDLYAPGVIEGTLAYMSPEQTGRINRSVDYRTDLYSLGVTLYEMLTGIVPFRSDDPLEVVHSHIARVPVAPDELNRGVPAVVSAIVMKLLAKSAEERYQNGLSLAADFADCTKRLAGKGRIEEFEIAVNDISSALHMPQVLVGRERELEILSGAFSRVSTEKNVELLLVTGSPGIGKTALVQELRKPVVMARGFFLAGKFEQYSRDIPYSAIAQGFEGLVSQVLAESPERISRWKEKILGALGPNGSIIIEVIHGIEQVIGSQPAVEKLGPQETLNRFNYTFKRFMLALLQECPLVLFLDDLQWADLASLNLLKTLITDFEMKQLLVIGAYRDSELTFTHPLFSIIDDIKKSVAVGQISLPALEAAGVIGILSIQLHSNAASVRDLGMEVYAKTGGNPFFVQQFMKMLYEKELLRVVGGVAGPSWQWDARRISELPVTENVLELMSGKINELPAGARTMLEAASFVGMRFHPEVVARVLDRPVEEVLGESAALAHEGFITVEGEDYRFYHDKIQEAAYSRVPADGHAAMHLRVGMTMLALAGEMLDESIISIVDQLNRGIDRVGDQDERNRLADLNLRAGRKARHSGAFHAANQYFKVGVDLLPADRWKTIYSLTLALYTDAAETSYLNGDYAAMNRLAEETIGTVSTMLDLAPVYIIKIQAGFAQNNLFDCLMDFKKVCTLLGLRFPLRPNLAQIFLQYARSRLWFVWKNIDTLASLPEMTDDNVRFFYKLSYFIAPALYSYSPRLTAWCFIYGFNILRKYGRSDYSLVSLLSYGIILIGIFNDITHGYELGKLLMHLSEKMELKSLLPFTALISSIFILHWKEHIRNCFQPQLSGSQMALEYGDFTYASIGLHNFSYFNYFAGNNLPEVIKIFSKNGQVIKQLKQETYYNYQVIFHQCLVNMVEKDSNWSELSGTLYDEHEKLPGHLEINDKTALADLFVNKVIVASYFNEYEKGYAAAKQAEKYNDSLMGLPHIPVWNLHTSLICLAQARECSGRSKKRYLRTVMKNQRKMKIWAFHAPMNNQHRYDLVAAEIAHLKRNHAQAGRLYDRAINGARKNQYVNEEALACERAAFFYRLQGHLEIAEFYLRKACRCYQAWGALAKVRQLEAVYPEIIGSLVSSRNEDGNDSTATSTLSQSLDISTVLKTSQALSCEIDLGRLLEKMLRFAMENAGAQRGCLILEKGGDLFIEAEGAVSGNLSMLQSIPVTGNDSLSPAIVNYVNRTGENLVLEDAYAQGMFINDPYVLRNKTRSLLCAPMKDKGNISCIIYLENNHTPGAFTSERLELLNVLSAQAAISIENARLVAVEREKAAIDREIQTAERIQRSLLPREIPDIPGARVAYKYVPMMGVGGDFVAIRYITPNRLGLFICDVSGHGIPAAMTASMISTSLNIFWDANIDHPAALLREMRTSLRGKLAGVFFTACACTLDLDTGALVAANAGHPQLVIIGADGNTRMSALTGRLINDLFEPKLEEESIKLLKGDRVILYTDGITEAENATGAMLGTDDAVFCRLMKEDSAISAAPDDLCEAIYSRVIRYTGSASLGDDVTILACEFRGNA